MQAILKSIDRLCLGAAYGAAVLLAVLFLLGFSEIVLRSGFGISLPFSVEYSGYLLVLVLFLGSGWTLSTAGHIRVTLVSEHISDRAARGGRCDGHHRPGHECCRPAAILQLLRNANPHSERVRSALQQKLVLGQQL